MILTDENLIFWRTEAEDMHEAVFWVRKIMAVEEAARLQNLETADGLLPAPAIARLEELQTLVRDLEIMWTGTLDGWWRRG